MILSFCCCFEFSISPQKLPLELELFYILTSSLASPSTPKKDYRPKISTLLMIPGKIQTPRPQIHLKISPENTYIEEHHPHPSFSLDDPLKTVFWVGKSWMATLKARVRWFSFLPIIMMNVMVRTIANDSHNLLKKIMGNFWQSPWFDNSRASWGAFRLYVKYLKAVWEKVSEIISQINCSWVKC